MNLEEMELIFHFVLGATMKEGSICWEYNLQPKQNAA